jgi:hypothetical protein
MMIYNTRFMLWRDGQPVSWHDNPQSFDGIAKEDDILVEWQHTHDHRRQRGYPRLPDGLVTEVKMHGGDVRIKADANEQHFVLRWLVSHADQTKIGKAIKIF